MSMREDGLTVSSVFFKSGVAAWIKQNAVVRETTQNKKKIIDNDNIIYLLSNEFKNFIVSDSKFIVDDVLLFCDNLCNNISGFERVQGFVE